jgi:hypothetical protein
MEEVEDEPLFADRVAGLDIGKAGVEVTIRVPGKTAGRRRRQETRTLAPPAGSCWTWPPGWPAGRWPRPGWKPRATTCDVRVHEFKWEAPLEVRLMPEVQYPGQCALARLRPGVRRG